MKFLAFYKTNDTLIKAYETADGQDIVAIGANQEFWFSHWRNLKKESVLRAMSETCKRLSVSYREEGVVFTGS